MRMINKNIILGVLSIFFAIISTAQTTLISTGSSWKYLANGSDQGTVWKGSTFDDALWSSGTSQFGYGDGDEATVVSYGTNASNKYITTYFRKNISISSNSLYSSYTLNIKRDDGVVIYINGVEKYRNNMPTGTIAYNTLASSACSDDGVDFTAISLSASSFITGTNVVAVEIHQNVASSSDLSFDLKLVGNPSTSTIASLVRGPYLQSGTPTSVYVLWRSNLATDTKVNYGLSPTNLNLSVSSSTSVVDHTIKLTGLTPNTKYYYSIGSTTQTLQGDASNYFITAPSVGTEQLTRVWVTGDCGSNTTNQLNVRNQYYNYIGNNNTDVWLLLGDNAYNEGLDAEYQSKFFEIYKDKMLKQTVLWPVPGNHDYASSSSRQNDHNIPYYSIFRLPTAGQAGGVASGTEAYYSYNYANIHFIALDSYGKESNAYRLYDTLGPQAVWLKQDLAANTQKWTIVYWHHPPYTMGSHNSDTKDELIGIRQNLLKILERYKVDLVLCGHSHDYERTKLMKGHFGYESSFNSSIHNLSNSSAKYDGSSASCPYVKNATTSYNGTVYVVSGSSAKIEDELEVAWPHNAMHFSDATNGGSLALEILENRLNAKWICADGVIRDQFTIVKDVNKTTNITISQGQNVNLTASWVGNYAWSTTASTRTINVAPTASTSYSVNDGVSCLSDVFNVTVTSAIPEKENKLTDESLSMKIYPNPVVGESTIEFTTPFVNEVSLEIYDMTGRKVKTLVSEASDNGLYRYTFNPSSEGIVDGTYLIQLNFGEHSISEKIIIKQ